MLAPFATQYTYGASACPTLTTLRIFGLLPVSATRDVETGGSSFSKAFIDAATFIRRCSIWRSRSRYLSCHKFSLFVITKSPSLQSMRFLAQWSRHAHSTFASICYLHWKELRKAPH